MKAKNKKIFTAAIYAIILIAYFIGFSVVFNIKNVLGIGHYYGEKDFSINMDGASCGLNIEMYAIHRSLYEHDFGYMITTFSNGDVELEGIEYLFYTVRSPSSIKRFLDTSYNPPIHTHSVNARTRLYQSDNLTIQGHANVTFKINDVFETRTISFDLGIIIELDGEVINYEFGNISTWLNVLYISFTVVPMMLFYRSIRRLKFDTWYNDEFEVRDKKFFEILSRKKKAAE
ncbi:MAG: hypothetical protein EU533_02750 [Promethearchaeota archaeon]|nr:MAG: hypothetical protein EU533_02750 [Candidatus Lokiarchaeota archaeon]